MIIQISKEMPLFFLLTFLLILTGCEVSDFKFPEIPKTEPKNEDEHISHTKTKPMAQKQIKISGNQPQMTRQDPNKDFDQISHTIIRGQPIHPFPPN